MDELISKINESNVMRGVFLLFFIIGSRYLNKDFHDGIDNLFDSYIIRQLVIFSAVIIATKDVKISLLLTLGYIVIFHYLLRSKNLIKDKQMDDDIEFQPPPMNLKVQRQLPDIKDIALEPSYGINDNFNSMYY